MSFSVVNALIANKNNQIVVDYSAYHGNFQQIELMILKKINNSTIGEIKYNNQYKFYFEKENEITYMCLVKENESLPHTESLYTLLYDLKHKFLDKYNLIEKIQTEKKDMRFNSYEGTDFVLLDTLIESRRIQPEDVIMDVGCGTGIFLCYEK